MASQINKRNQVSSGKNAIINRQVPIPNSGTHGKNGVLNARGKSGIVLRMTNTPKQTNIKANKVPILVISPTILAGTNAAKRLTKSINNKFDFAGVL